MITSLAKGISAYFADNKIIERDKQDLMRYGLEIIISTLIGTLLLLIMGIILKSMVFTLVFASVFITLRQFTGGFHADSYFTCNLSLVIVYILTYSAVRLMPETLYVIISAVLLIFTLTTEALLAPVDSSNKRLTPEKKKKFKICSLAITAFYSVICLMLFRINADVAVIVSMTLLSVSLLMIAGKIKNRRCQNER